MSLSLNSKENYFNGFNKHSLAAYRTLNNGRTLPMPYWVYLLLGRVNFTTMHTYYIIYTIEKHHLPGMKAMEIEARNDDEFWHKFKEFREDGHYDNSNPYNIRLVSFRAV